MTDLTLAALLADPDPAARLIAADRLAEAGDEIGELICRLRGARAYSTFGDVSYDASPRPGAPDLHIEIVRGNTFRYRLLRGWTDWWGYPKPPPPGLEAAVLAVLRGRLEEVRLSS